MESNLARMCVCVCLCVVMVTSPASWISATCSLCGLRQVASSLGAHLLFCKVGLIRLADKVSWGLKKIKCAEPWAWAYCSSNVAAIIIVFVFPKMSRERTPDNFKALLGSLLNACTEVGTPASTPTGGSPSGNQRGPPRTWREAHRGQGLWVTAQPLPATSLCSLKGELWLTWSPVLGWAHLTQGQDWQSLRTLIWTLSLTLIFHPLAWWPACPTPGPSLQCETLEGCCGLLGSLLRCRCHHHHSCFSLCRFFHCGLLHFELTWACKEKVQETHHSSHPFTPSNFSYSFFYLLVWKKFTTWNLPF